MSTDKKPLYEKHHSFSTLHSRLGTSIQAQRERALHALAAAGATTESPHTTIIDRAREALETESQSFTITRFIADEMSRVRKEDLARYLYHRFRYDVFPKTRELDDFPPYLQIEPTSYCNYRCVFCYQTDKNFSAPPAGHMGQMSLERFSDLVDQIEGQVEFCSLASRGEPLLCKEIDAMVRYCSGKFLGMKLNTNASALTETHCHALLSGGLNTIVFSVDATQEPAYSNYRVGGSLERVTANIKRFEEIRQRQYPESRIISRVSGVAYNPEQQNLEDMISYWSEYVDQVAFVRYNPWEGIYQAPLNGLKSPCSDLWRRMFVWHDGVANPCDSDYCSKLRVGNAFESSISELWRCEAYERLREAHSTQRRTGLSPCNRCMVV